ncbi:MAG: sulfotransferase [Streptosporangiales bacterium]|nr:sulfotransferase [Streptosporangiales bacterium]
MEPDSELIDAARARTGLDDFGGGEFREGLEILVGDLRTTARLNAAGESYLRKKIVGLLAQRLQVEDWYRRHPEIADEPVTRPLFGLGLPRTGSTALSFLLAADPRARYLRLWEGDQPCPPPSAVDGAGAGPPDTRIADAQAEHDARAQASPRHDRLVPNSPEGPVECLGLLALDFKSNLFNAFAYVPDYTRWLLYDADLTSAYAYEKRVLKLLQWGYPARPWRLKAPTHLMYLEPLLAAFPDARFVMTHRDPAEVMVSVADLFADIQARFNEHVDLRYLGATNVEQWAVGIRRGLAFRDDGHDHLFYDIGFRSMQTDPVGQVRGLYDWLGEPVTPEFEAGMRAWWQANSQAREKVTHPDPAALGIDPAAIRPLFADYTARSQQWASTSPAA